MSQARIYHTKVVRKDWTCGSCGAAIRKGIDGRISFAVGFRGREQTRCLKPECRPSRSTLESSAVAAVYDAMDSVDFSSCDSAEDFENAIEEIASACDEVADEYESNEMYEINYDLQERAETVRSAGDELRGWTPEGDEPEQDDFLDEDGEDDVEAWEAAREQWLDEVRTSAQDAVDSMELP